jgi:hypothetical protein
MGRMIGQFFAYVCVATVLAQTIGLGYAWSRGKINGDKIFRMVAVAHDVDLKPADFDERTVDPASDNEDTSYEQRDRLKAIVSKNLDLRLQALDKGVENLAFDRRTIQDNWNNYERIKADFEQKWDQFRGSTQEAGLTEARLIWAKMKPKQVKNHIMSMVDKGQINDVVVLLSGMPNDKRAKIIKDFTAKDEQDVLNDIVDLIRRGDPATTLIEGTMDEIRGIQGNRG